MESRCANEISNDVFYSYYLEERIYHYLGNGDDIKALFICEEALKFNPDDEYLLFHKAIILSKFGFYKEAMIVLNKIQASILDVEIEYLSDEIQGILDDIEKNLKGENQEVREGSDVFSTKHIKNFIESVFDINDKGEDEKEGENPKIILKEYLEDIPQEIIEEIELVDNSSAEDITVKSEGLLLEVYEAKANIFRKTKQYEKAIEYYDYVLHESEEDVNVLYYKSICCRRLGKDADALDCLMKIADFGKEDERLMGVFMNDRTYEDENSINNTEDEIENNSKKSDEKNEAKKEEKRSDPKE